MLLSIRQTFQNLEINNIFKNINLFWCISVLTGLICEISETRGASTSNETNPKSGLGAQFSPFSTIEESNEDITIERSNSSSPSNSLPISIRTQSSHESVDEVIPGCYFKSKDLEFTSKITSSVRLTPEYRQPMYHNWNKITRSTMGLSQYRKVTAKYAYTRRFEENQPPYSTYIYLTTSKPEEIPTFRTFTKEEHFQRMTELYEEYKKTKPPLGSPVQINKYASGTFHFGRLDIRVGRISQIMVHPGTPNLYICDMDIGVGHPVQVVTSLGKTRPITDLIMRWAVVLVNVKPLEIMGYQSCARIINAVSSNNVDLLYPPDGAEPGDIVSVQGFPRIPFPELDQTKRIFQIIRKHFKSNNESVVCFRHIPWEVEGKGFISTLNLPNTLVR